MAWFFALTNRYKWKANTRVHIVVHTADYDAWRRAGNRQRPVQAALSWRGSRPAAIAGRRCQGRGRAAFRGTVCPCLHSLSAEARQRMRPGRLHFICRDAGTRPHGRAYHRRTLRAGGLSCPDARTLTDTPANCLVFLLLGSLFAVKISHSIFSTAEGISKQTSYLLLQPLAAVHEPRYTLHACAQAGRNHLMKFNYTFSPDDMINPVYCRVCRTRILIYLSA